jgi:hypothetical protein
MITCGIVGDQFADVHSLLTDNWLLLVTVSRMLLADGQSDQLCVEQPDKSSRTDIKWRKKGPHSGGAT